MRNIKITGYGYSLPKHTVKFNDQTRYRLHSDENFMDYIEDAVNKALTSSNTPKTDIDCIIAGMATPLQAIPCNAALIHERVFIDTNIPALDINTSCTSFVAALDMASYLIDAGRYNKVLIVSGDLASSALNPNEKESYELFSDVAVAFIVEATKEDRGIIYSKQSTWSLGAHYTEIPKGGSLNTAFKMTGQNKKDYYFTMDGLKVAGFTLKKMTEFLEEAFANCSLKKEEINLIVPHQASRILSVFMKKLGFKKEEYIDIVKDYGNMVSGSVPFALCIALDQNLIKRGDNVALIGTAAGMSINFTLLKY